MQLTQRKELKITQQKAVIKMYDENGLLSDPLKLEPSFLFITIFDSY